MHDIARLACESTAANAQAADPARASSGRAALVEVPADAGELHRFFHERRWSDGLPVIPPTPESVARMLRHTERAPGEVVALLTPTYGAATVERIAINAVIAGCEPDYLPVLIAATEAMVAPEFNLQSVQTTTNPAAVWLIVNGPIAQRLMVNAGGNCLGSGALANATLGRALRLIQQNIGGAQPGDTDRATQGQPGKYTFCCAENVEENPWEPLHVERGFAAQANTVTVVGALGTWNIYTEAKDAHDLLRVIADTMTFPAGSDYVFGGEPWLVLCPEHARVLKQDGLSKAEVKRQLWELSKMAARRLAAKDLVRTQGARRAELGEIGPDTLLPITVRPENISIIVAGGEGNHSTYIPNCGLSRSVTRAVAL